MLFRSISTCSRFQVNANCFYLFIYLASHQNLVTHKTEAKEKSNLKLKKKVKIPNNIFLHPAITQKHIPTHTYTIITHYSIKHLQYTLLNLNIYNLNNYNQNVMQIKLISTSM